MSLNRDDRTDGMHDDVTRSALRDLDDAVTLPDMSGYDADAWSAGEDGRLAPVTIGAGGAELGAGPVAETVLVDGEDAAIGLERVMPVGAASGAAGGGFAVSGEGDTAAPLPDGTIQELADYLKEGFWDWFGAQPYRSFNMSASGTAAKNGTIHYNYTGFSGISGAGTDSNGLTTARRALVDDVFDYLGSILNINFVQTTSTDPNVVDIFFKDNDSGAYANSDLAASGNGSSNHRYIDYSWVNVNSSWSGGTSDVNDYTWQTFVHEIFHAMGLGHQGAYNGTATYITDSSQATGNNNVYLNDSWQMSIMSYIDQVENTTINASYAFVLGGMQADWEALDDYYSFNAFTGNTVYGFNTNISASTSQVMADLSLYADEMAFCIRDDGGIDTLDFSGYAANQLINLRVTQLGDTSSSASNIGGLTGNMTIAVGTVIENAKGGSGNDQIYGNEYSNVLTGNAGDDTLKGLDGNDTLYGGSGVDTLEGGDGNDVLNAGTSVDWVYGGAGNDTIIVGAGNFYDNVDGGSGTDTLDHSASAYGGNTFDFKAKTITGPGVAGGTADLENIEIYYDGSGSNTIVSSGTSGTYYGGGGDDVMIAEIGGETMYGGTGIDTIDLSRWGGTYVVDMATGSSNYGAELFQGFENLISGAGNDTITGTSASNEITTGGGDDTVYAGAGQDTINGGAGNDLLQGGFATDTVYGGAGNDIIRVLFGEFYDAVYGGAGIDTLDHSASGYSGNTFDFEAGQSSGPSFNSTPQALQGIEIYYDGTGSNTIVSSGTSGTYYGGDGDDVMISEIGGETMYGGNGIDTIDHSRFSGDYAYDMVTGLTNYGLELYTGFEIVIMGSGNDTVTTTAGADTVYGGAGNDWIIAGDSSFGNGDVYDGGAGDGDTLDFSNMSWPSNLTASVVFNLFKGKASYNGFEEDILNFENFSGSQGGESVYGGSVAQTFHGNAGEDLLRGKGGDDLIYGGADNDVVNGGLGNDTLYGGDGDDLFFGKADDDLMFGDDGNDVMNGVNGADTFFGGAGDDIMRGGAKDDWLRGGDGVDTYNGGNGQDVFDVSDTDGDDDVIIDYKDNADKIRILGESFGGLTINTLVPGRVEILYYGGAERVVVRDGGLGQLTDSDFTASDFLFV